MRWRETLDRLDRSKEVDSSTYALLLRCCGNAKALPEGKRVHELIVKSAHHRHTGLSTLLIRMYGECGSLEDALAWFTSLDRRHASLWNFIIRAHAQKDKTKEALKLFDDMRREGVMPDKFTFVCILSAHAGEGALEDGKRMHAHIQESGFKTDVIVGTALVGMYGKCGNPCDALRMFERMPKRDVVSWNTMITVYNHHGQAEQAIQIFEQMQQKGVTPNRVTFLGILDACASQSTLAEGKWVHACILESRLDPDLVVGNSLVNMYGKYRCPDDAHSIFQRMPQRDVISWTTMISVYAHHGKGIEAVQHFVQMQQEGILPDKVALITVVEAFASQALLAEGKSLHLHLTISGTDTDIPVANALVSMYGKCGSLEDAREVFENLPQRDVVTWTTMIAAYTQLGQGEKASQLFHRMQLEETKPNKVTFICSLDACASCGALAEGERILVCVLDSGLVEDVDVGIALINMYGKCGNLQCSWRTFKRMPKHNVVSWTTMIAVCTQLGQFEEALKLFDQMYQTGEIPNNITFITILDACAKQAALMEGKLMHSRILSSGCKLDVALDNALMNMYVKCGSLLHAQVIFNKMPERNVVSWTSMIAASVHYGQEKEALLLYDQMQGEGTKPDKVTFVCVLDACAIDALLAEGESALHDFLESGFELDAVVGTALINMYGKCGSLEIARRTFDNMPHQNLVSWTTMIAVYADHGQGEEALELFNKMQCEGVTPDKVTFVSVLTACSHDGLIDEGKHFFNSMIVQHGIFPIVEHYVCMVDLLGRAGRLDEAEILIKNMNSQPSSVLLMAMLGACKYQADVQRGERIAQQMFQLDPESAAPYVMLSNIYSAACRVADAAMYMQGEG